MKDMISVQISNQLHTEEGLVDHGNLPLGFREIPEYDDIEIRDLPTINPIRRGVLS